MFKNYVSKEFSDFIEIKARQDRMFSGDAAIVIPWEDISLYVMDWDNFITKYPSSFFIEKAIHEYFRYMSAFLFGDYNSLVWDESGTVKNDIHLVFNTFLKKHPNSKSAKILEFYLKEIEKNNEKVTDNLQEKVDEFMEQIWLDKSYT